MLHQGWSSSNLILLATLGVLNMGNGGESKVIYVGYAFLQTNMGMKLLLKGVKHAPNVI